VSELRAVVYVSWGLWVADCPRPDCRGAEHFGHAPITGAVGGLTQVGFACARCGLVCPSQWPDNAEDIWRLLQQRPIEETRNWMPGEELADLVAENIAHGLVDLDAIEPGVFIENGHLTGNGRALAAAPPSKFAIGGRS
jgi:hypothetical protein